MLGNMYFKATPLSLFVGGVFALIGLIGLLIIGFMVIENTFDVLMIFFSAFALLLGWPGCWLLYAFMLPTVINVQKGYCSKGRLQLHEHPHHKGIKDWCALKDIHALQITSKNVRSRISLYRSHELNIIKKDATRLHIVEYDNLSHLRADANTLAKHLNVPIWDVAVQKTWGLRTIIEVFGAPD